MTQSKSKKPVKRSPRQRARKDVVIQFFPVRIELSNHELEFLRTQAKQLGVSVNALVRSLIRNAREIL